jgi:hypothetical protein
MQLCLRKFSKIMLKLNFSNNFRHPGNRLLIFEVGMILISRYLSFTFLILSIFSCKPKESIVDIKYGEVMEVHDEIMPQMEDIYRLRKQLQKRADSLSLKSSQEAFEQAERYREAMSSLTAADKGMMEWMRNFNSDYKLMEEKEAIVYLEKEKMKVEELREKFNFSIAEAKRILKN